MLTTKTPLVERLIADAPRRQAELQLSMRLRVQPHNPYHAVMPDGAWRGEPCFIVAGGPSLTGFDFGRLRGRGHVIAINRALEFVPWADIAFFMDKKLYKFYHTLAKQAAWEAFRGHRVFLDLVGRDYDDCYHVRSLGRVGITTSIKQGLYHGNNSGVGALNLAICLRASPIYLLGYDCRHADGRSHFHDGYGAMPNEHTVRNFVRDFERQATHIRNLEGGWMERIINLNPASGLRIYRFSTIGEVLDGQTRQGVGTDNRPVSAGRLQSAPA